MPVYPGALPVPTHTVPESFLGAPLVAELSRLQMRHTQCGAGQRHRLQVCFLRLPVPTRSAKSARKAILQPRLEKNGNKSNGTQKILRQWTDTPIIHTASEN